MEPTFSPSTNRLRQFFLLSFVFSWAVWIAMIIFNPGEQLFIPLLFLGAFGPSLVAVFLIGRSNDRAQKRDFWSRIFNPRRITFKRYLFIFLIFPAILVLGYSLLNLAGLDIPSLADFFEGINGLEDVVYLLVFMLLGGPLAEELGWRGYALEPMHERFGKLQASLLLGMTWVVWHLPLFFIEGTSQFQKGFGISFWSWALQLLLISVIFTWVYNNTRRSILAAVLLHLMANFAYPLNPDWRAEVVFTVVRIMVVLPIILQWRKEEKLQKQIVV